MFALLRFNTVAHDWYSSTANKCV